MTFHWPHAFWLLLIPIALLVRDFRRRRITMNTHPKIQQAEARHSSFVIHNTPPSRLSPRTPRLFLYLGLMLATAALARPQWGRLEEPVFDQAREIIIALDLSRSMLAEDIKPNRLERARLLITSLLERLKGERVGLIVFSGTAFLQSPLSSDYEILREFLLVLNPDYLPEGGTNYDALLETTITAFGASGSADRFLIVLSDGEAQSDTWQKHVSDLKTKGIRVLGLGIGTDSGAIIPDGQGAYVKDERGAVVLSKLTGDTLRQLAEKTDGRYTDASSWVDLAQLIASTVEQGRAGEFKETSRVRLAERFQWPLAAALGFFLLSFWRESPVRPKPRHIQLAAKTATLIILLSALSHPAEASAKADAPLTTLVTQLAARETPAARDYAELARTTITYGERAKSSDQPIPESVVRDALAAVSAGSALDPKAADWPALREELETLLPKKEEPPPKQDSKPDEKKPEQNKNEKSDDQSGEQGESSDQPPKPEDAPKSDSGKPQDQQSSGSEGQPSDDKSSGNPDSPKKSDKPGQSAFGDMKDQPPEAKSQPPAQPQEQPAESQSQVMQQVGGASTEVSTDPALKDPALAVPLQKLDQVKQGDSPARLFQLLQENTGQPTPPAPPGKNW
jgi:Ca-activated chloride channel family protein